MLPWSQLSDSVSLAAACAVLLPGQRHPYPLLQRVFPI